MMEATDGRLFYAPIDPNPQKVIDLGTGTGLWAIESTYFLRIKLMSSIDRSSGLSLS